MSYSISTSNHNKTITGNLWELVVSYSISTSNHNKGLQNKPTLLVVSYSISTSNHNRFDLRVLEPLLCLILFLHQTTTAHSTILTWWGCVLFYFYIKPQPKEIPKNARAGCVLFYFYIKPQLGHLLYGWKRVVSYSISTSNHNMRGLDSWLTRLCLILFLHQTTTDHEA